MPARLDLAIQAINAIADKYCENQIYVWPGFDPMVDDPVEFFRKRRIEFDGELCIRYPVKATFAPISLQQINKEERAVGCTLPHDYTQLLQSFGELHPPGQAMFCSLLR